MKKFVLVLALVAVMTVTVLSGYGTAQAEVTSEQVAEFIADFVACRKDGSEVTFLQEKFGQIENLDVKQHTYGTGSDSCVNIVCKKSSNQQTSKQIIIGAHYDAVYGSQGANDNASGVTALYLVMLQLQDVELPFNVVYVAFDCEEDGMVGSQYFVNDINKCTFGGVDDTLVMFNMDSIANGDNLYVGCESVSTDLANLVVDCSDGAMVEKPHAIGTSYASYGVLGYYDYTNNTDHAYFRLAGIPTVNIFSGNFDWLSWSYYERDDGYSTLNSSADTLENLQRDGKYLNKIQTVANTVVATVCNDKFSQVADNARSQLVNLEFWFNPVIPFVIKIVAIIIVVVFAIRYSRKLQKDSLLNTAEAKFGSSVFSTPDAEDVFSFGGDNSDDIFRFKD